MSKIHDLSQDDLVQETKIYRFLHQLNICSDTAERLQKKGDDLGYKMKFERNSFLETQFNPPDIQTITELAVVIEPLVRQSSDIYYTAIFELCRKKRASPELESFIANATSAADEIGKGDIRIDLDGKDLTPAWMYEEFMDKILNADDVVALKYEQNLSRSPVMNELFYVQVYHYCMNMVRFLLWIQGIIKQKRFLPEGVFRDYLCIICRCTKESASFTKVEHILPEALGNRHSILPRGYYCDACQDLMAPIEGSVVNQLPFSMTSLFCVKHTKSGRFPSAKFERVHYRKRRPNYLEIDIVSGKEMDPFTLEASSKSKFDHIALGRVLVKAALGAMTLELGREYVLNELFDPAREFVQTGKGLHTRLLMQRNGTPDRQMNIYWQNFTDGSVRVIMRVHGFNFVFAVTPIPYNELPPKEIIEKMEVFDLWNAGPTPHYWLGEAAD